MPSVTDNNVRSTAKSLLRNTQEVAEPKNSSRPITSKTAKTKEEKDAKDNTTSS
jgi:hypothetical protein